MATFLGHLSFDNNLSVFLSREVKCIGDKILQSEAHTIQVYYKALHHHLLAASCRFSRLTLTVEEFCGSGIVWIIGQNGKAKNYSLERPKRFSG